MEDDLDLVAALGASADPLLPRRRHWTGPRPRHRVVR